MKSMQTAMLERIETIAGDLSLTPLVRAQWANTGQVFFKAADFSTALVLSYDFQDSYCTIALSGDGAELAQYADDPPRVRVKVSDSGDVDSMTWHALHYSDDDRVAHFFDTLTYVAKVGAEDHGVTSAPVIDADGKYEITIKTRMDADSESGAAAVIADALRPVVADAWISVAVDGEDLDAFTMTEFGAGKVRA